MEISHQEKEALETLFKSHKFVSQTFTKKVSYCYCLSKSNEVEKKEEIMLPCLIDGKEEESEKFVKNIEELKKTSKRFENASFRTKTIAGDVFKAIDLPLVYGDDEKFGVYPNKNEAFMLLFWNSEDEQSLQQMGKMDEFIKKFRGNLQVISINTDRRKDLAINNVYDNNGWCQLEHYYWKNEDTPLEKYYTIGNCPLVLIYDQDKVLKASGNPLDLDLERITKQIISGDYKPQLNKDFSKTISKKIKDEAVRLIKEHKKDKYVKYFVLNWQKEVVYDLEGNKIWIDFEKPSITWNYSSKFAEEAKIFEEKLYSLFEKGKETFKKIEVKITASLNLDDIKVKAKNIRSLLDSKDLQDLRFTYEVEHCFNEEFKRETCFRYKEPCDMTKKQRIEEIRDELENFKGTPDIFKPLAVREIITEEESMLAHDNEKVTILIYAQDFENDNVEYFIKLKERKLEKWKNRAKFVFLSGNTEKNVNGETKKFIEERKLTDIACFKIEDPATFLELYDIDKDVYPALIIDTKGSFFSFREFRLSFIERINDVLEIRHPLEPITKEDSQKLREFFKDNQNRDKLADILNDLSYNKEFFFCLKKNFTFNEDFTETSFVYTNPELNISLRKTDFEEKLLPILKPLFDKVPLSKFKSKFRILETIQVKKGTECHSCKIKFKVEDPQYQCYECQIWFCQDCAEKRIEDKEGSDSLVHPHNLVWIDAKDEKLIPAFEGYKLGENRYFKENTHQRFFGCNGCEQDFGDTAYICLNCRPGMIHLDFESPLGCGFVDICQDCHNLLRGKEENKGKEEILEKLKKYQHDPQNHVFLRVCFGDNYSDY